MHLTKIVSTGVAAVGVLVMASAGPAGAADVYYGGGYGGYKDLPVLPPANPWQGPYIGANIGGSWANIDENRNVVFFSPNTSGIVFRNNGLSSSGILGGVQGGYNWQSGNFVYGFEFDLGALGNSTSRTFVDPNNLARAVQVKANGGWYGDITGRIGYGSNNVLLYGKGGLALFTGGIQISDAFDAFSSDSGTFTGWTIGAGLEYQLTPNWTAKVEYMFFDFGNSNLVCCNNATFENELTVNTVKVGFNYLIRPSYVPLR